MGLPHMQWGWGVGASCAPPPPAAPLLVPLISMQRIRLIIGIVCSMFLCFVDTWVQRMTWYKISTANSDTLRKDAALRTALRLGETRHMLRRPAV